MKTHFTIGEPAIALDEALHDLPPPQADQPRVVFKGGLRLTREQEDALVERAATRFQQLDDELGRSDTLLTEDGLPAFLAGPMVNEHGRQERKFFHKRLLYSLMAENDYSWRPTLHPGSIFAVSNLVVPVCRRIASQSTARAVNYFFGSDPWLKIDGIGIQDDELAKALQKYAESKLSQNQNHDRLRRSLANCFNLGESVLKVAHTRRSSFFRRRVTCLVSPDGKPALALDGQPIEPADQWVEIDGQTVLKRDGATLAPPDMTFAECVLDEEIEHYRGPEIKLLYYRDFLAPLNADTLQSADCVVHILHYTANALAADYMENPGESIEDLQAAIDAIRQATNSNPEGKAAATYRPELGDTEQPELGTSIMEIGEFCIRYDADGDGYEEDIMLVMDMTTKTPIFYDYQAAMTADGLRPYFVVVPRPVNGRWYGQGTYEYFDTYQSTIDLMANRRNRNQSEAGRVTFWNPRNTIEGEADPSLRLNWGKTYTLREQKKPEDALSVIYLEDNKYDKLTEDIQFFLQLALNESGVQTANDAGLSGLESTKLATGIRNIEKTAQEMFAVCISDLEGGLTQVANAFVHCLYGNLDDGDLHEYFEGNIPPSMATRDIRHLKFDVHVLLSRYKDEQMLASSTQAIQVVKEYYSLPPNLQAVLQKFYADILSALQVKNAENYLIPQPFSVPAQGSNGKLQTLPQDGIQGVPNL
jgi:hypothetical protein